MTDLFDPARMARAADPGTSQSAAVSMKGKTAHQHRAILDCLSGGRERSAEELGNEIGYPVWRRLSELERQGRVVKTVRVVNASGRSAYRYRRAS